MKRTQIQLDEKTWEVLRERAFRERRSIADVVRGMLRVHVKEAVKPSRIRPFSFIGSGASHGRGRGTIAGRHDDVLGEALRREHAL